MELKKSLVIECVASTPAEDVTGETLDIEGADISPLLEGRGHFNSDHRNDFSHTVGKILDAKKILKLSDCSTPTQIKYWGELNKPFIWMKGELYDGVGHKEADSIASIYKFYMNKSEPPPVKISVEGKTLERNGKKLTRTLIKGAAMTLQPCNRETRSEVVEIRKSYGFGEDTLAKSEEVIPVFIESDGSPFQRVFDLAIGARDMLRSTREKLAKSEIELKGPALLERLKQETAAVKRRDK